MSTHTIQKQKSLEIGKIIIEKLNIPNSYYELVYGGKAIAIKDDSDLYIWIRVIWNDAYNKCNIQIANVNIPEEYRRTGRLNNLINGLKKIDYVDYILIFGVCTKEMENFCEKHKFRPISKRDYIVR